MRPASILLILEVFMDIALATIGLATCFFLVLLAFVGVSVHILRCTENAQETFSWASVGRSIRWAIKCVSGR